MPNNLSTAWAVLFVVNTIACGGDDNKPKPVSPQPMAASADDSNDHHEDDSSSTEAICGNGKVEGDEQCDDGNQSDDDDCTHKCTKARCGDGIVSKDEACDDGNDDDADGCTNECKPPSMSAGSGGTGGKAGASSSAGKGGTGGQAERGGAGGKDGSDASGVPGGTAACTACRTAECTDYEGLGYNVVTGCFETIDTQFDASAKDPTFIQDCTAVVRCAYEKKCGFGAADASECFCGTADTETCFDSDSAANGPCMAEVEQAARSEDLADIGARFSDKAYPMGWAADLIDCDHKLCQGKCMP